MRTWGVLSAGVVLLFSGCGSNDQDSGSQATQQARLPSQISVLGTVPSSAAVEVADFGGSKLVSLNFSSSYQLQPNFQVSYVVWGRATETHLVFPAAGGCDLTGTEVFFGSSGLVDVHLWGWDKAEQTNCQDFLGNVLAAGIQWTYSNTPTSLGAPLPTANFSFSR